MKTSIRNLRAVKILIILGLAVIFTAGIVCAGQQNEITKREVLEAQKAWADALVKYREKSTWTVKTINRQQKTLLMSYTHTRPVRSCLKPTKASDDKFRTTREGAISYFIGHNKNFPEDKGFALQPWTNVRFKNGRILYKRRCGSGHGKIFFSHHRREMP